MEQWAGGTGDDVSIERPHCIWSADIQNLEQLKNQLAAANRQLAEAVQIRRQRALEPSTDEYNLLLAKNEAVRLQNAYHKSIGQQSRKHKWTPERLFKHEDLEPSGDKGGLNFVWYAFEILQKKLFPYYEAVQAANPSREVVIAEDNDPSHLKARRLLAPEIAARGIKFTGHPASSPDFNLIESIQHEQNKLIQDYRFNIRSSAKAVKAEAERELRRSWQSDEMDRFWLSKGTCDALKIIADRCRDQEGGNHFVDNVNTFSIEK